MVIDLYWSATLTGLSVKNHRHAPKKPKYVVCLFYLFIYFFYPRVYYCATHVNKAYVFERYEISYLHLLLFQMKCDCLSLDNINDYNEITLL